MVPTAPEPLSVCPRCGRRMPKPKGAVTFEYGIGPVGHQHCEACDTRWRYVWHKSGRGGGRGLMKVVVVVLLLAAAVAAGVFLFQKSRKQSFPEKWDVRVAPIAAKVASLRGLTFKHPVKVNYLTGPEFTKMVTAGPDELKKRGAEIDQAGGVLRAGGLIGAKVNLARAINATQAADTIAFYDSETKEIYVRGAGPFTVETRVTLAHELTHVLQDQYFDLGKLTKNARDSRSGSSDALTALVEGDATRIEEKYLANQPPADRQIYTLLAAQAAAQANASTQSLPAVVATYFNAPYVFGPPVIHVLDAQGGNAAINAALTGGTPSTRLYLDPTAVGATPTPPDVPKLQSGETKIAPLSKNDNEFDNFTLYLMLAARMDLPTALRAADAYSSGSEVLYKRGANTCFRAAIVGDNPAANTYLASVIRRWTQTVPDAGIEPAASTTAVVFHSCDPGPRAVTPANVNITGATRLAANRDALVASLVNQHLTSLLAVCASRVLVQQPDVRDAIMNGDVLAHPTPQMLRESATAGVSCRSNPRAGLPG